MKYLAKPQHMHKVVLGVCVSVSYQASCYIRRLPVQFGKVWCYKVPYGIPNTCIVWIYPKTLCSPVLASFADSKLLDFSPLASDAKYSSHATTSMLYTVCA